MSKVALKATRATVYRWFAVQCVVVALIALLFLLGKGKLFAGSVLLGAGLCIVPSVLFARWWLAYYRVNAAGHLVKVFYLGSMGKLFLIGVLFLLAQRYLLIDLLACLIGFIVAQIALWLTPLFSSLMVSKKI